jgi:hypothetical protein
VETFVYAFIMAAVAVHARRSEFFIATINPHSGYFGAVGGYFYGIRGLEAVSKRVEWSESS